MSATDQRGGVQVNEEARAGDRPWTTVGTVLLVVLLFLHILPVWWFRFFPSQDGPAHLENAAILREYHQAARPLFREFYTLSTNPDPNWFSHLVLAGLMYFLPPLAAEKVLLTGYVVALPLAVRYALGGVRPGAAVLAVLILPFLHNLFYHMGFYNFCYSLAAFFLVVGYWLRRQDELTLARAGVLSVLGLVLFFCHLVSLGAAGIVIAVLATVRAVTEFKQQPSLRAGVVLRVLAKRVGLPLMALLPSAVLGAQFIGRQGVGASSQSGAANRLGTLASLEALVSYDYLEGLVSLALACSFGVTAAALLLAKVRRRDWERGDGLLVAALVLVALYLFVPQNLAGGMFLDLRLNLFPFFLLLLWFGSQPAAPLVRLALPVTVTVCALLLFALHTMHYAERNEHLAEYASAAEAIEDGRTLLPLCYSQAGPAPDGRPLLRRVGPFLHAGGYLTAGRHLVDLKNYEATTGYFPVQYRPELNPFRIMGLDPSVPDRGLQSQPPRVRIARYEEQTGRAVDYVLLWDAPADHPGDPILRELKNGYRLVFTSSPRGLLRLYERAKP